MITPAYVRTMAAYNSEMNRRLYGAASRLSDVERRRDRGAFWGSLHATLVHILWGDGQWMSRFDGWQRPTTPIKESGHMLVDYGHDVVQRRRPTRGERAVPAARHAFLQSPDASPRPSACADHRRRRKDRGHRFVPGSATDDRLTGRGRLARSLAETSAVRL